MFKTRNILIFMIFIFSFFLSLNSQIRILGEISGVVVEEGGEGLPGVSIKVTGEALQRSFLALVTENDGRFFIPNLQPGIYTLEFTLSGFTTVIQKEVRVYAGRST
ncbi:MAG: carboxypeptidase-like regulatory domain-containing protein, partial [Candidatus Aminicenantes bacterium]|nr:carboxypeptidase-like regulatory domain-containing protein [Candidatus Aminicenantes bacterium]